MALLQLRIHRPLLRDRRASAVNYEGDIDANLSSAQFGLDDGDLGSYGNPTPMGSGSGGFSVGMPEVPQDGNY